MSTSVLRLALDGEVGAIRSFKRALWTFVSVEVEPGGDQKQVAYRIVATGGAGIDVAWKRTSHEGNDHLSAGLADRGGRPGLSRQHATESSFDLVWSQPTSPTEPKRKDA